ncbi:MAG: hypothetical protein IJZ71_01430 [Treponema sp.]|nr:hypothetical protein [Treponema sp.]
MHEDGKRDAFDKLVAGLNTEDRNIMLSKLNANKTQTVKFVNTEVYEQKEDTRLSLRLKNESVFYKFLLWLRSLFSKEKIEELYSEDLIAKIAKSVDREFPHLIHHQQNVLDSIFYERLKALKDCADFFKPYFALIEDSIGDFYVFLSSFVTPQIADEINSKADPFTLPFSKVPSNEVKKDLVIKMDKVLKDMAPATKNSLYTAISSTNWLMQFTKLPFLHFLSQFTNISGDAYTCPYSNARNDFIHFAKVFTNVLTVENNVLEAIFLFSQRKNITDNAQEKDIDKAVNEFLSKTNMHFSTIQMFISGVPIVKLGKIINRDVTWSPENMEGAEAWFPSFRNQWHKIIDIRWNDWQRERKKSMLSDDLKNDFMLDGFPVMQYKPWELLWTRVPFSCELTGGFLSWFALEKFPKIIPDLNTLMMEGVFVNNENRNEYSEALSEFIACNNQMQDLLHRLSEEGEYGQKFIEFSESKVRSFQTQNQIDSMMSTTESEIRDVLKRFCKTCRTIELIFHGIFDDEKDGVHETLQNYSTIKGPHNRQYRENLGKIRKILKSATFYIAELEPIDNATMNE